MAIAFVNSATGAVDGSGTTVASGAQNHTGGNFLAVGVEWSGSTVTVSGVADTAGNSYTSRPKVTDTTFGNSLQLWYVTNITGNANNVITATFSGSCTFKRIIPFQYSGVATTTPFDVDIPGAFAGSGTTLTSGSFTPSEANEVAIVFVSNDDGLTATFSSTDYAVRVSALSNDTGGGDRLNPPTSSQTAVFTQSVNVSWRIIGATFKQAGGGGVTPHLFSIMGVGQ